MSKKWRKLNFELVPTVGRYLGKAALKKLKKLNAIKEAVNNLKKSFGQLEGRIHTLEDAYATTKRDVEDLNPFAPGDFAEKRVLKLVEWFSGHCRAIKS